MNGILGKGPHVVSLTATHLRETDEEREKKALSDIEKAKVDADVKKETLPEMKRDIMEKRRPKFQILDLHAAIRHLEETYLRSALWLANGNKKDAAEILGLLRTTFVEKVRLKYPHLNEIDWEYDGRYDRKREPNVDGSDNETGNR